MPNSGLLVPAMDWRGVLRFVLVWSPIRSTPRWPNPLVQTFRVRERGETAVES